MIEVTRLDGTRFVINSDLIEFVETTPDTVLTLITHKKLVVREPADEVVRQVVAYKRRIHHYPPAILGQTAGQTLCMAEGTSQCPYRLSEAQASAAGGHEDPRSGEMDDPEAR